MVSILYILPRMGFKMEQEKFKNLARIDPWELFDIKNKYGIGPISALYQTIVLKKFSGLSMYSVFLY